MFVGDKGEDVRSDTSSTSSLPPLIKDPSQPDSATPPTTPPPPNGEDDPYIMQMPLGWRRHWFFFCLAGWWAANTVIVGAALSVVWPSQISAILNDPDVEDLYNGFVPAFGAIVSVILTPISGALSDHSQHKLGRRRVYIIVGSIIGTTFFVPMAALNNTSGFNSIWALVVLIMGFQFGQQLAGGPYAGLLPDLVPKRLYGLASGWLGMAIAFGDLVGVLGAGFLVDPSNYWPAYMYLFALYIPFTLFTIMGVKEIPRPPPKTKFSFRKLIRDFYLDPKAYRNFYWVILTRFFMDMGVYSILPYFSYYYKDVMHYSSSTASLYSSLSVATIVIISLPSTIIAGKLSDKTGRKSMVYLSTALMSVGCAAIVIICFYPTLVGTLLMAAMVGAGYGAYQAVDWALALDILPEGANIAKDMGVWHLSFVTPQVIAPVIAGAILQAVKNHTVPGAYATLFGISSWWFLLASVFVYPIDPRIRTKAPIKMDDEDMTSANGA